MKERMPEETVQLESGPLTELEFLRMAVKESAIPIARFGMDPTELTEFELKRLGGKDEEIAQALSEVKILDPYYKKQTSRLASPVTDEFVADALLVTVAKAEAVKEQYPSSKKRLDKFEDTILDKAGRFLAGIGGTKALAATSALSLLATSCGIARAGSQTAPTPTERPAITEPYYPTATPEPTETTEITPTSVPTQATATEVAPTPTSVKPTETATPEVPTPEKISWWQGTALPQESAAGMYYDSEYLKGFTSFKDTTITVAGKNLPAVEGIKSGGETVILAAEMSNFDGQPVWARVSEEKEVNGRKDYAFINPDWDLDGAVQVNDKTAGVLNRWLYQALFEGQFKGRFASPEALRSWLMNQGTINLKVPRSHSPDGNDWLVDWVSVPWNPQKPMEMLLVGSKDELAALRAVRPDLAEGVMDGVTSIGGRNNPDEPVGGGFFTANKDGHGILVAADGLFRRDLPLEKIDEILKKKGRKLDNDFRAWTSKRVGIFPLRVFYTIGDLDDAGNAFSSAEDEISYANDPGLDIMFETWPEVLMTQYR